MFRLLSLSGIAFVAFFVAVGFVNATPPGGVAWPYFVVLLLILNCRDEIIPVLRGLQHIYSNPILRNKVLNLVAEAVNGKTRKDCGREGLDY